MSRPVVAFVLSFLFAGALSPVAGFVPTEDGLYAVFTTDGGEFTARLDYTEAPHTVANFVLLAEGQAPAYDPEGGALDTTRFFDGLTLDAVLPGERIVLGGAPERFAGRNPHVLLPEIVPGLTHSGAGVLSMESNWSRGTPLADGTRFSIALDALPLRDGRNAVFGRVIEGLDVLPTLAAGAEIEAVTIVREGAAAEAWVAATYAPPRFEPLFVRLDPRTDAAGVLLRFLQRPGGYYRLQTSAEMEDWATFGFRDARAAAHAGKPTGIDQLPLPASIVPASGRAYLRLDERIPAVDMSGRTLVLRPSASELGTIVPGVLVTEAEITLDFATASNGAMVLAFEVSILGSDGLDYGDTGVAAYQWFKMGEGAVLDVRFASNDGGFSFIRPGDTAPAFSPVQPQRVTLRFGVGSASAGGSGTAAFHYFPLTGDATWGNVIETAVTGSFELAPAP
jgi:cyclophilin family peptidyl-prolyl cis-trans isomerase